MSSFIGRLQKIGIAKESEKGIAEVPTYWLSIEDWDLNPIVDVKEKEGAFARIEDAYNRDIIKKHNEPKLGGIITDKAFGLLLYAALGAVNSSAKASPNASVCDHTFSVQNDNSTHPVLTVSLKDDNMIKQVPYCMLNKLSIEAKVDDYARFVAEFIGKFEADKDALTPAYTEENAFVPKHISLKLASSISGLAAASAIACQNVKVDINKNSEPIFGFGSAEPSSIDNKQLEISGSFDLVMSGTTYRDLFTGNTKRALRLTMTNSDVVIGTSANPQIQITLGAVRFNPYKMANALGDYIRETLTFKGYYDPTETKSIEIVLTNLETSY